MIAKINKLRRHQDQGFPACDLRLVWYVSPSELLTSRTYAFFSVTILAGPRSG